MRIAGAVEVAEGKQDAYVLLCLRSAIEFFQVAATSAMHIGNDVTGISQELERD